MTSSEQQVNLSFFCVLCNYVPRQIMFDTSKMRFERTIASNICSAIPLYCLNNSSCQALCMYTAFCEHARYYNNVVWLLTGSIDLFGKGWSILRAGTKSREIDVFFRHIMVNVNIQITMLMEVLFFAYRKYTFALWFGPALKEKSLGMYVLLLWSS